MTWTVDPTRFAQATAQEHLRVCRRLAILIDQLLVVGTPVDTGRARSNWRASVGSPDRNQYPAYAPGDGGDTANANNTRALAQARGVIDSAPEYPVIYLSNNLDYIQRLNEGYSAQAPSGYVEAAIEFAVSAENRRR